MLAELLSQRGNHKFLVPGTHGMIFPWSPPLDGIPLDVLKELEAKLTEKLVEVAENWITHRALRDISRQSSASQLSGSEEIVLRLGEVVQSVRFQ
jgi:hypothetical protein